MEEMILMPKRLTAENGAKHLLIGEFYVDKYPIPWATIKDIYSKIVDHFRPKEVES
jgi:hypothetical protein